MNVLLVGHYPPPYGGISVCSAPLKSSHLGCLLRPVLDRAPVAQGAVWPPMVVPVHPVPDDPPCVLECLEGMLPDTLLFETRKESLNDPILLRRIRRDALLLQPIVPTGLPKSTALEDQPVVAP